MVFLGKEEEKLPYTYEFSSYYYGPFSRELAESIESLVAQGALQERSIGYPYLGEFGQVVEYDYSLTRFGLELLKIYSTDLTGEEKTKIKKLCEKFDKMSLNELISYVYTRYVKK
jgi:uncharacterized protein YwgA